MKISVDWLGEYVTWSQKDPHVIADRLTLSTAEVEEVEEQGALLNHCCVGEVLSMKKHPDADRLCIAEVKTDKGTKTVVCGGTNVREGMHVAFAHVGATVKWHGEEMVTLEPVKIRGVASEGMICAGEELGIAAMFPAKPEDDERPIVDLSDSTLKVGSSLKEALGLHDTVFHFSNTAITARPDLFSHLGFARECVALGMAKWKKEPTFSMPKSTSKSESLTMQVDVPKLAPRYLSCMIEVKSIGETPDWMKQRLEAIGHRSINLPVDITNYVANEIGVPLHSFDADDIKGDVHLRLSKKGEKITTLDGVDRTLPEGALILSDDKGIFDLLGIMGGLRSSTKDSTKHIYLHAAMLDPVTIRKAIIATGHRTDAATVYEKGVPAITTEQGFIRALELFLELIPGAKVISAIEDKGDNGKAPTIKLSGDIVRATLGIDITDKEIKKILEDLECSVSILNSQFSILPPLHRLRDLTGPHDIIEEIGRIHGFNEVPLTMPQAALQLPKREQRHHQLREELSSAGYWELVPLSFVSPDLLKRCNLKGEEAVRIENPLGEETSLLHTCPLPRLLEHAETMLPRADGTLRTFQCGNVFEKDGKQLFSLGMLLCTKENTSLLNDPFLTVKSDILRAIAAMGHNVDVVPYKNPPDIAHPGRSAEIFFAKKSIGEIYEIHPVVRERFGLPHRVAAATLDLSALLAVPSPIVMQQPLSQFPAVTYDVTVKRTSKDELGPLLAKLTASSKLLEKVSVQDLYAGKPLAENEYNLTLRFVYRSAEKTLTEDEAKKEHEKIAAML